MTNLTEQWEKGELPSGRYWVKMSYQGAIIPLYYSEDYGFEYDDHFYDFEEISEVLAEVPSFEEYQQLLSDQLAKNEGVEINAELEAENAQLKELLKECKHIMSIEKDFASCHFEKDKLCKLLTKINQVLGEE